MREFGLFFFSAFDVDMRTWRRMLTWPHRMITLIVADWLGVITK